MKSFYFNASLFLYHTSVLSLHINIHFFSFFLPIPSCLEEHWFYSGAAFLSLQKLWFTDTV